VLRKDDKALLVANIARLEAMVSQVRGDAG